MKVILAIIMALFTTSVVTQAQTAPANPTGQSGSSAIMAASNSLKILSPTVDEKVGSPSISVRYQLVDGAASAAPSPTYRVQLDSRDPAETLDTEYTFTGLAPGPHVLTVELVDANHTTIGGSRAIVHFKTFTPGTTSGTTAPGTSNATPPTTGALAPPTIIKASMPLPESSAAEQLPAAGGELPLLSLIGFGVLVGGVLSAMRVRK